MGAIEIITAIELGISLLGRLNSIRASLKQSGELTPEQDAALDARFKEAFGSPHWQPSTPPKSS